MTNKTNIKWDIKRGYGVYKSVTTDQLLKWLKEGKLKEGEVLIWTSGMSGWRRPEEVEEFKNVFAKAKAKAKAKARTYPIDIVKERKKYKLPKIVILDDEQDMCWLLENYLTNRHFRVFTINTGREGLELIKQEQPDVVLLDLKLKDVDGMSILKKIKELWPKIKMIIISAFGGPLVREKASDLGADGFVDKPFNPEDIVKVIKNLDRRTGE